MGIDWWFDIVQKGGAVAAVLELGALIWMAGDRNRLIDDNKSLTKDVKDLAERLYTVTAELKTFLFSERRQ